MLQILNNEDISTLDRQIEQLTDYKPIPEHEVKQLCDKVDTQFDSGSFNSIAIGKGNSIKGVKCSTSQMSSDCLWRHPRSVP